MSEIGVICDHTHGRHPTYQHIYAPATKNWSLFFKKSPRLATNFLEDEKRYGHTVCTSVICIYRKSLSLDYEQNLTKQR